MTVLQHPPFMFCIWDEQGRTDNSWGPWAIGDYGPLCPCPHSKKAYGKVPGASHGAPY
ncbi:unnamed protein product [Staurois parvus]|uniref:Uncharacterized protein n=1 Tax=Staurois parvus TaxID=386267 RepID=A0ABN9BAW1_9NEOB|nr:unnamed protein product [Staurois parvus]